MYDDTGVTRRIRRLEAQVALLSEKLGVPFEEIGADSGIPQEVVDLAQSGNKIQAIKRYRELTGVGLAEAKDVVDGI
jgi:ribosomal protein L7/L12